MGHNYYLYENNGKFVIIPWDLNIVFGTFNLGLNRDQMINIYIGEPISGTAKDKHFNGSIKSRSDDGSGNGGDFGFPGFMRQRSPE